MEDQTTEKRTPLTYTLVGRCSVCDVDIRVTLPLPTDDPSEVPHLGDNPAHSLIVERIIYP